MLNQNQNFTASFLNYFGKEITDDCGNPIHTLAYLSQILNYRYRKAMIVISIFENQKSRQKEPIIRNITDISEVEKLGYGIYTVPLERGMGWKRAQRNMFQIIRNGSVNLNIMTKRTSMPTTANERHIVQIDEANLLIRLIGPRAGPTGEGPWLPIGDD